MENQKQEASLNMLNAGTTLQHRQSPSYVCEYADRTVVLLSKAPDAVSVNLVFGRDTAEIKEEHLVVISENDKVMTPGKIETYRLDLASITLPAAAAKYMAQGILRALEEIPQQEEPQQ